LLVTLVLVPLDVVTETVLLAVVVSTPIQMYWTSRMGTAVSELESPKYTSEPETFCTQVNVADNPVKSVVSARLRPTEAMAGPKHSAELFMSCMPAS
jgi:hypothetical protein